ncbi:hypothetical protein GP486_005484 [Trichoglossum hirsutum]|uniref:Uncharacterized protein n=1 Tax=Trichoglossum hirsutum TaxID=265104 RepID=A0A9P8L916_9PEZI|nr:hypothetical protein GP486_005484 [Trichoglossum hirsutum]
MAPGKNDKKKGMERVIWLEEHLSVLAMSSGLLSLLRNEMAALQEADERLFEKRGIADQSSVDGKNFANVVIKMEQMPLLLIKDRMELIDQKELKGLESIPFRGMSLLLPFFAFSHAPRLSNKFPRSSSSISTT